MDPTGGHANLYQTKLIWQGSNHQNIENNTEIEYNRTNIQLKPEKKIEKKTNLVMQNKLNQKQASVT